MKSPKCVTLLSHFYLGLLFLWDRTQHINRFSMYCSYVAQDKMNWTAVRWGQFANRSLKLAIHWRHMSIGFLLAPKEDLPQHCHLCPHDWWHSQPKFGSVHHTDNPLGKSPQQKLSSWSIAFPCQPYMVLSTKSCILILLNHVIISHRHGDIWVIILAASAKADR